MELYTSPVPPRVIPLIDLNDPAGEAVIAQAIHRACRESGFFYVLNHGVSSETVEHAFAFARMFFDLPLEEKQALDMKKSRAWHGYDGIGGQALDNKDDGAVAPPDLKESFHCGLELDPSHPFYERGLRGFGHNQWPDIAGFKYQMQTYDAEVRALAYRLIRLFALSLDLPENWFDPFYDMSMANLRLIKYPPQPVDAAFNQLGAGAHTDWGAITILAQDDRGGLEVRNAAGEWIEARPIPGTFVINLGDLMARWTNGLYNSNMHRVKNNVSGTDRYSMPFFFNPAPDAVIEPIPTCLTADNPSRFEACTAFEHLDEMMRRSHAMAATA